MAHVQIKTGPGVTGVAQLIVDGKDISREVMAEGLAVEFPTDPDGVVVLHLRLPVESLDLDLPEAVIEAARHSEVAPVDPAALSDMSKAVEALGRKLDALPKRVKAGAERGARAGRA